ncbi:MAG: hypothetical protein LC437_02970 [Thiohalomonas sp.]|nr:hypothetical protein [Thiohalomonas sp.]
MRLPFDAEVPCGVLSWMQGVSSAMIWMVFENTIGSCSLNKTLTNGCGKLNDDNEHLYP